MKIFLSHSSNYDYKNELYEPIKNHFQNSKYSFIYPEELKINTKELIKNCDYFFCEISCQSVGSSIETGWADAFDKPIYCFYKTGTKPSSAFKYLTDKIYEYNSTDELLKIISELLKKEINY